MMGRELAHLKCSEESSISMFASFRLQSLRVSSGLLCPVMSARYFMNLSSSGRSFQPKISRMGKASSDEC